MIGADNVYELFGADTQLGRDSRLALLAEILQSFAASLDIDETLNTAIERFIGYLDAEAASIFLLTDDRRELICRGCVGPVDITGLSLPAGAGIVGKTVSTRSSQIVRDVRENADFAGNVDQDTGFETRSILCAPLMVQDDCLGALELINKRGGDGLFDHRDENILVALASAAALAIHNARMAERLVSHERMQKELELAREIQEGLLPVAVDNHYPVQGVNFPAREVSGDFYDFFSREDGLIYFNLADVSGKGMNAALLMAKVSSLLHHLARVETDPGALLARVNDEICETVSHGMFVTLVSGFLDPASGNLRYANAGHQPPLFRATDGSFREIPADSPPLGILPGIDFPETHLALDGGCLYLFTDGVTESRDQHAGELGVQGLINLIGQYEELRGREHLDRIITALRGPGMSSHDDITLLMVGCHER